MSLNITNLIHRMCHRIDDVMKLCCELSANHQIQATVKGSGKGAAAAGGLALAGGLVGGPLGIAVGQCKNATEQYNVYTVFRTDQYC